MKKCDICQKDFSSHSLYANHIRWVHRNNDQYLAKSSERAILSNEKRFGRWMLSVFECQKCGNPVEKKYREGKDPKNIFCSISCANSRKYSESTRSKVSKKIIEKWKEGVYDESQMYILSRCKIFSSKGERELLSILKEKMPEYKWASGGGIKVDGHLISRDMYSDINKICIEYDGIWHFKDICGQLEKKRFKDELLNEWCRKNQYRILRISDDFYRNNRVEVIDYIIKFLDSGVQYMELYY